MRDRRGHSKERPGLIVTPTADIRDDKPFIVIAITTTFPDPPPDDYIPLPWHPQGRAMTKLRKRSAAVLSWVAEVEPAEVKDLGGDVPVPLMIAILKRLDDAD